MVKGLLSFWQKERCFGIGNAALLEHPLTAFFASRRCSGHAIRIAMDWAVQQASTKTPLIGGFHSPLEQSVLEVILSARSPGVVVIARKLPDANLPGHWRGAIESGNMAVVGIAEKTQRLTPRLAIQGNHWVARPASRIAIAEAAPDGSLAVCIKQWQLDGHRLEYLVRD